MDTDDRRHRGRRAVAVVAAALDWVINTEWPDDPSLYHGTAGIAMTLVEVTHCLDKGFYPPLLVRCEEALVAAVDRLDDSSLYFGLTGVAVALRALGRDDAADRALRRVRAAFDGERWSDMFELLLGNAGIALGALSAGDLDLAVLAVEPYLRTADRTPGGVNWANRPSPPRSHHMAHGTLGIAYALAAVGAAAGRDDMIETALAGAADVVSRNEAGPDGFLVPHSDPPHRPDIIERYSFGWCNGPTGDAQAFRLLGAVTGDPEWSALGDRCWHTITTSGLPERIRPGFWDNNGHCCGTAVVLALACDRIVERGDDFTFADVLVEDLIRRWSYDDTGTWWSNVDHRSTPSDLPPVLGWAMGSAGIIRELLRYERLCRDAPQAYGFPWPDHPPADERVVQVSDRRPSILSP